MSARRVGRPTKYNQAIQDKAEEYLSSYLKLGELVPTVVGLAIHMDVTTKTIYNWATEEKPEFLRIFTRVEQLQHRGLVNGGLSGEYNPAITKMMLTHHGYSDKQQVDLSSTDRSMTPKPTIIELVAPRNDEAET